MFFSMSTNLILIQSIGPCLLKYKSINKYNIIIIIIINDNIFLNKSLIYVLIIHKWIIYLKNYLSSIWTKKLSGFEYTHTQTHTQITYCMQKVFS